MNIKAGLSILDVLSGEIDYFDIFKTDLNHIYFSREDSKGELIINGDCIELKYCSKFHQSMIYLAKNSYAKVTSKEGEVDLPVKMLAFVRNGVIFIMHYIVDENEKVLTVNLEKK